jgi:2'-5' RNA ligase
MVAENYYAVVAYLPEELGSFLDRLRRRFDPGLAAWLAHVTILPPRPLPAPLDESLEIIRKRCALVEPFEAVIQDATTFWPVSGVVYLSFSDGVERLVQLHDALNSSALAQQEAFPYVPHVTIAQDLDEAGTQKVLSDVAREWAQYDARRAFDIASLSLVQHTTGNRWINLAPIPLGDLLTPSRI